MIPDTLEGWTLDVVREVAASGIAENDLFDVKADLQPAEHQRKAAAAFANTRGGFLVFGVTNDKQVVGVQNLELPRDFGTKLRAGIEPSAEYRFGTPLLVEGGRAVFVAHVPRSSRGPHGVLVNHAWVFLKRTPAGSCEAMSYEEVRLAFQDTETRRTKLALVLSELELIQLIAKRLIKHTATESEGISRWAMVSRYPTTLLDSLLGDAFALLAQDSETWKALAYLRDSMSTSNIRSEMLGRLAYSALNTAPTEATTLQGQIRASASEVIAKADVAKERIMLALGSQARLAGGS